MNSSLPSDRSEPASIRTNCNYQNPLFLFRKRYLDLRFFLAGFLKKDRDLEGIDRVVDEYDETVTSVFLQEFMDFFIKEKKEIRDCRGQNQDKNSFHPLFSIFNDRSTRTHNTSLSI